MGRRVRRSRRAPWRRSTAASLRADTVLIRPGRLRRLGGRYGGGSARGTARLVRPAEGTGGRHRLSPATMLIVSATMTVPNRYDSNEWRSTVARNSLLLSSVSETWNVIPTVNAR